MKRTMIFILAGVMVLGLAGCKSKEQNELEEASNKIYSEMDSTAKAEVDELQANVQNEYEQDMKEKADEEAANALEDPFDWINETENTEIIETTIDNSTYNVSIPLPVKFTEYILQSLKAETVKDAITSQNGYLSMQSQGNKPQFLVKAISMGELSIEGLSSIEELTPELWIKEERNGISAMNGTAFMKNVGEYLVYGYTYQKEFDFSVYLPETAHIDEDGYLKMNEIFSINFGVGSLQQYTDEEYEKYDKVVNDYFQQVLDNMSIKKK